MLPPPADREAERAATRWGKLPHADPVFTPAARVPLAGLLLAIPALQTTGLLPCAATVFGCLPNGFYGLDTMLLEGVLRALAGQPRGRSARWCGGPRGGRGSGRHAREHPRPNW